MCEKLNLKRGRQCLVPISTLIILCLAVSGMDPDRLILDASAQDSPDAAIVFFNPNEHGVRPDDESGLNEVVTVLKNDPGLVVVIDGYSDITGEEQYNLNLSRLRAEAVREFYVGRGIDTERIKVRGNGKTDKFDSGIDEESLKRNRRVQISVESAPSRKTPSPEPPAAVVSEKSPPPAQEAEPPAEENGDTAAVEDASETGPGEEPAVPAITEPSAPPPDLEKAIGRSMRRLAPGLVVFDAPRVMNIGETYEVEVDLPYSFLKGLSDSLHGMSGQGFENVRLGQNIGLSLNGRGFDIRPVTDTGDVEEVFPAEDTGITKLVTENTTPIWKWKVTPLTSGYKSLLLSVELLAEDSDYNEMVNEYQLYQKVVEVKPSFIYTLSRSYWMMTLFIVIVVAVVGWVLIKKIRVG
ncbi:MAG TPA: OmpA family protein [Thermodesulfobacteriota bacterium]|nr:OmpA family protein [Thermodesulfobacteriota bacterium]